MNVVNCLKTLFVTPAAGVYFTTSTVSFINEPVASTMFVPDVSVNSAVANFDPLMNTSTYPVE